MSLITKTPITITRYGEPVNVKGRLTRTVAGVFSSFASIQPLNSLRDGGEEVTMLEKGNEITKQLKMFTKFKIEHNDEIRDMDTNELYKVHYIFDYNKYSLTVDHYKCILMRIDNA